jgi:subtilisin-like proprotein convertase family protein
MPPDNSQKQIQMQNMKKILTVLMGLAALCVPAQTMTNSYTLTPNVGIPGASPVGITEQFAASGMAGTIADIQVTLDITGGFNGNLYAYLAGPQGQFAVLLNRVGVTAGNPFGFSDAGMNIMLDGDAVNNIHNYGSGGPGSYSLNGTMWAADGRNIDPLSAGSAFDAATTSASLSVFQNTYGNGVWTLFIADLSASGSPAILNSATLSIITVPEPQTWVMLAGGAALLGLFRRR